MCACSPAVIIFCSCMYIIFKFICIQYKDSIYNIAIIFINYFVHLFPFHSWLKLDINFTLGSTSKPIKLIDFFSWGHYHSIISQYFCDVHSSHKVRKLISRTFALWWNSKGPKFGTTWNFIKTFWIETVCMCIFLLNRLTVCLHKINEGLTRPIHSKPLNSGHLAIPYNGH